MPEVNNVVWEVFEEQFMRDPIIRAEVERRSLEDTLKDPSILQDERSMSLIKQKIIELQLQNPEVRAKIQEINRIRDENLRREYIQNFNKYIETNAQYIILSKVYPNVRIKKELKPYNKFLKEYDKLKNRYNEDKKNLYAEAIGKEEGILGKLEEIVLDNNTSREKRENAAEDLRTMRNEVDEEKKKTIDKILETRRIEDAETAEKESHIERNTVYGKPLVTLDIHGRFFKNKNWYLVPGLGIFGKGISKDNFAVQGLKLPKWLKRITGKPFLQFEPYAGKPRDTWFLYDVYEIDHATGQKKPFVKLAKKKEGDEQFGYAFYREAWKFNEKEGKYMLGGLALEDFVEEHSRSTSIMPEEYATGKKGVLAVELDTPGEQWEFEVIVRPLWNIYNLGPIYKLINRNRGREYYIDKDIVASAALGRSWSICDKLGRKVVGKIQKRSMRELLKGRLPKSIITRRPQYRVEIYDKDLTSEGGKMALSLVTNFLDSENLYKEMRYSGIKELHPSELYKTITVPRMKGRAFGM